MHSDQFWPKSYLKGIKRYIFSEGEQFPLTRAPLGVQDFHALLGVFEHPLLTRLLGHVAIRERRRSKERQK